MSPHRLFRTPTVGTVPLRSARPLLNHRRHRCGFGVDWLEDRTLLATFLVTNTTDSGPGSLRQAILDSNAATGEHEHHRLRHPGRGRPDDRPALRPARDHPAGADRRLLPAGLRRHAAHRAERQPGRRRRRPDDHRLECHGPRPGHQRLLPGRRHPHHGNRRDRRLDLWQLPRHRSDRHAGRAQQRRGRDRRGSDQQPGRDQRRRRERREPSGTCSAATCSPASGSPGKARRATPWRATGSGPTSRDRSP